MRIGASQDSIKMHVAVDLRVSEPVLLGRLRFWALLLLVWEEGKEASRFVVSRGDFGSIAML